MKFRFDANQEYQLTAIQAVVDLFKGQSPSDEKLGITQTGIESLDSKPSLGGYHYAYANQLSLSDTQLQTNLKAVQDKNAVISDETIASQGKNFSIEMETGTGKTYVYLRSLFELNQKYNFKKFIIVVPSIAVREGVLKSLEIMQSHFKELYNNIAFRSFVYNSKQANKLRGFATGKELEIMIINIDAFNKDSNVIRAYRDQTRGIKPLEFIKGIRPILIIDEAQNMESKKSKEAIQSLNPLFCLRYSATHRNLYNPLYCLNPIQAFQKKLVKKISVASVLEDQDPLQAHIKVLKIINRNNKITCTLQFFKNTNEGRKLITKVCQSKDDLFALSNENPLYQNGFKITEISCRPGQEFIRFANSVKLSLGQEQGGNKEQIIKVQIRETIKAHFEKELQLKNQGIKVLSLFFLDRVENYRIHKEGHKALGPYAKYFEEIYQEVAKGYTKELDIVPAPNVHNGYFSKDKQGHYKNTKGHSKEDSDTYSLIMKDKERLLNINNPLKFIFSHSALREGWDNPNIFQIGVLNQTQSFLKKRQEIGRGLRLPVNQKGERIQDDLINHLTVIANESYNDFAKSLQKEMEEDCGIVFGSLPKKAFVGMLFEKQGKEYFVNLEQSKKIWEHIKQAGFLLDNGFIKPEFNQAVEQGQFFIPQEFKNNQNQIIKIIEDCQLENYIQKAKNKVKPKINKQVLLDPEFKKFWEAISQKTVYSIYYKTADLVKQASKAVQNMEAVSPPRIAVTTADIQVSAKAIQTQLVNMRTTQGTKTRQNMPNILDYIAQRLFITKKTVFNILKQSGRLSDFYVNPQQFMDLSLQNIREVLQSMIIEGIKYEKLDKQFYEMSLFEKDMQKMEFRGDKVVPTKKSVYDYIYYDSSTIEKNFAKGLENLKHVKYFIKLPNWFKVPTPVGDYVPDWAILKKNGEIVYMIRETKATLKESGLRGLEKDKSHCGKRHFESLGINYKIATDIKNADL